MQLSTSEISELIKSRLENFSTSAEARTQGTVISVTVSYTHLTLPTTPYV